MKRYFSGTSGSEAGALEKTLLIASVKDMWRYFYRRDRSMVKSAGRERDDQAFGCLLLYQLENGVNSSAQSVFFKDGLEAAD
jgi:hypothetical protein